MPKWIAIALFVLLPVLPMAAPAAAQQDVKTVSMDFNQIDIQVFIKFISELTGKNFVVDDKVRGKVTVLSPTPVSVNEAFTVFESVLEVNGFTTIPGENGVTKIVPSVTARQRNVPIGTPSPARSADRFMTQIIPLDHASSNEVRKVLAPLISKEGILVAYPPNETLILTDYQTNIQRMLKIIKTIDVASTDAHLQVFYLQHGAAEKIVTQMTKLMQLQRTPEKPGGSMAAVADERMNAIVVLANRDGMAKIADLIGKLDRPTPEGKGKVQVVRLENALAQEMADVLNGLIGKPVGKDQKEVVITGNVSIVADKPTNTLVITADPEQFAVLEAIIKDLDSPRKQVYIEAAIMEVSDSNILSLGVNWNLADTTGSLLGDQDTVIFGGSNPGGFPNIIQGGTLVPPSGLTLGLLSFPFQVNGIEVFNLASLINLAKSDTSFNIISHPQIMTMENEEAKIVVADNIPFTTKTSQGIDTTDSRIVQSIEYRDVGVTLKVTPQINNQGSVKMKIYQEVSRIVEQVVADQSGIVAIAPTTKRRTAETTVEVMNGSTIVLAGLVEDNRSDTNQGVPGLSDVPALGWLFKSKTKRNDRTNLLVFITPRIVLNPNESRKITHAKAKYIDPLRFGADGQVSAVNKPFILMDPLLGKSQ
jgi:general secretion pathway protein D